jgi:hypothetical protein
MYKPAIVADCLLIHILESEKHILLYGNIVIAGVKFLTGIYDVWGLQSRCYEKVSGVGKK